MIDPIGVRKLDDETYKRLAVGVYNKPPYYVMSAEEYHELMSKLLTFMSRLEMMSAQMDGLRKDHARMTEAYERVRAHNRNVANRARKVAPAEEHHGYIFVRQNARTLRHDYCQEGIKCQIYIFQTPYDSELFDVEAAKSAVFADFSKILPMMRLALNIDLDDAYDPSAFYNFSKVQITGIMQSDQPQVIYFDLMLDRDGYWEINLYVACGVAELDSSFYQKNVKQRRKK